MCTLYINKLDLAASIPTQDQTPVISFISNFFKIHLRFISISAQLRNSRNKAQTQKMSEGSFIIPHVPRQGPDPGIDYENAQSHTEY